MKRLFNIVYGLGAAVVIIGALAKITHKEFFGLSGNTILTIGLVTEAVVFAISAFEPMAKEYDWSLVYPELDKSGKKAKRRRVSSSEGAQQTQEAQVSLSKKLDEMLKEANVDADLMRSLGASIKNFEGAAKGIAPSVDAMAGQKKYAEEMNSAAFHLESLNNVYKSQLEATQKQATANEAIAQNAEQLQSQMQNLSANLSSLNNVYGGMLTAMNVKRA